MISNNNNEDQRGYLDSFDSEEKQKQAEVLAQQQEAEYMLFSYIISAACHSETPLTITRKMAQYIGLPQKLPAGKILQAVTRTKNNNIDPEHHLSLLRVAFEEAGLQADDTIIESGNSDEDNEWLSVYVPDITAEESLELLHKEKWRQPELMPSTTGFSADRKKTKPIRTIFVLIAAVFLFVVVKGGSCSPQRMIGQYISKPKQSESRQEIRGNAPNIVKGNSTLKP